MAVSKSEERRLAHQRSEDVVVADLNKRLKAVEQRLDTLIDGLEWAANEIKPQFGFGSYFSRVLDTITKKLK